MIIPINDEWRIATDKYQRIIQHREKDRPNRQTGIIEENWKGEMFLPTYESAVRALSQRMVRDLKAEGIAEAIEGINGVAEALSAALPPALKEGAK